MEVFWCRKAAVLTTNRVLNIGNKRKRWCCRFRSSRAQLPFCSVVTRVSSSSLTGPTFALTLELVPRSRVVVSQLWAIYFTFEPAFRGPCFLWRVVAAQVKPRLALMQANVRMRSEFVGDE